LALAQATLGDRELEIDDLPRRFDAVMARPDQLPGLAAWQAFDVPRRLAAAEGAPELRQLLAELPELYARRGTPWGVRRFCEIYAGVRPTLLEHFRARGIWMIDGTAALGLDTALPGATAGGIVVDVSNVGSSGTEDADAWGSMLFEETAHRFTAIAPAATVDEEGRRALERALDAEKPAHTQYHLCLAEPRLRVGMQANLGLDAIVAGPAEGLRLDERGRLDLDARSAEEPEENPGAVGSRGSLGVDTTVG
jgi:hypothetical protein